MFSRAASAKMLRKGTSQAFGTFNRASKVHSQLCGSLGLIAFRSASTTPGGEIDQRTRLTTELKTAMKSRNTFASTVLRSVLAEVYTADKNPSGPISSSQITSILRKAIGRRTDSAAQFTAASRPQLAEAERREADLLAALLPPTIPVSELDSLLHELAVKQNLTAAGTDLKRAMGMLLKSFFAQIDKSLVDAPLVKQRAQVILEGSQHK